MSSDVDNIGVHLTHCCLRCGCKYGDPDCPVETGAMEASVDCEYCECRKEDLRAELSLMDVKELYAMIGMISEVIQERLLEDEV